MFGFEKMAENYGYYVNFPGKEKNRLKLSMSHCLASFAQTHLLEGDNMYLHTRLYMV